MVWLKRRALRLVGRILSAIEKRWKLFKLVICSLFYNSHVNGGYIIDTLMEPLFWFVDNFTQILGPIFVVMVIVMLTIFVSIAYVIGLPYWLERSWIVTSVALLVGNWLLLNVIFHYYMALTTSPGNPPENEIITEAVSICKKCIAPKPPRTHHCSVCDKCILKMDHHCPWLNNCVGYYNHRYFFMFCFYTWLGCIFVIIFGISIAYEHYFFEEHAEFDVNNITVSEDSTALEFIAMETHGRTTHSISSEHSHNLKWLLESICAYITSSKNGCIVFEMLTVGGVFVAVGALMSWHAKLITKGETCIESHINKKERERLAKENKIFSNPFNHGPKKNWKIFLGFDEEEILWRKVFFPSRHLPVGDGLHWNVYN